MLCLSNAFDLIKRKVLVQVGFRCCQPEETSPSETDPRLVKTAENLRGLTDPIRLKILMLLRDGEQCVCNLAETLGLSQSKVSYHLKVLTDVGLISRRSEWTWSYYKLTGAVSDWVVRQCEFLGGAGPEGPTRGCDCGRDE